MAIIHKRSPLVRLFISSSGATSAAETLPHRALASDAVSLHFAHRTKGKM